MGCFTAVYAGIGARQLAQEIAQAIPGGGWVTTILTQIALTVFGMFMDDFAMIMIFAPIFLPVVKELGFDTLWYGIVFVTNIQIAFLSPPYGFAVYCMKAAIPKDIDISMTDIFRAGLPFLGLQLLCLIIIMIFLSGYFSASSRYRVI